MLDRKTEQWKEWHEWWTNQKQRLRSKSTSPPKNPDSPEPAGDLPSPVHPSTLGVANVGGSTRELATDEEAVEENYKTTFSPDAVATRRDTEPHVSPKMVVVPNRDASQDPDDLEAQSRHGKPEIAEAQESPLAKLHNDRRSSSPLSIDLFPRPKSAPIQRAQKASSPISTRSSGRVKQPREHPSMKYWTEDGTDGVNPLPLSPIEPSDGGLLSSLLAGPPETTTSALKANVSTTTLEMPMLLPTSPLKTSRVRELVEIDSDGGGGLDGKPDDRDCKRQKIGRSSSEARVRRQILSPDLAIKNKGRGRYAESVINRYVDYMIYI